jgi:hypothetical protein
MSDEYDVSSYTEEQLLSILNLNNPSDRELEAKILSMIRKYKNLENPSGDKLATFFSDIYDRFFETEEENTVEGFLTLPDSYDFGNLQIQDLGNLQATGANVNILPPGTTKAYNLLSGSGKDEPGEVGSANVGYMISQGQGQGQGQGSKQEPGVQLTKPLEYSKDNLNPLLKQTIKRIISIDSQYRDNKDTTPTTNFTFNLSEPLRDVVSLSLYSIQIPYTWYTVNSDFGGNFFYLKGNAPGIDNGNHDYKISINPGNYISSDLVSNVNTSLRALATTYTDVSFGTTQAVYNNGLQSNASGTSKAQLQIDITKIYNESNYYLNFKNNWSSPNYVLDICGNQNYQKRNSTLGGYLGFNNQVQSCSAIYSTYFAYFSTAVYANNITSRECDVSGNGTFTIVPYVGKSYQTATTTYTPITITIPNGKYTHYQVVQQFNLALTSHPNLDPNYSFCKWVDLSGQDSYGVPLYQNGYSYLQISCKLNPKTAPIVENRKIAAILPIASNSIFVDVSQNSYNSFFKVAYQDNNYDTLGNIVCEFNTLYADASLIQTEYDVSGTTEIRYICDASGYRDLSANNYYINIPTPGAGVYTLLEYVSTIQTAINSYTNTLQKTIQNTEFSLRSDNHLYLQTSIRTTFTNAQYAIYATGKITTLFDISNGTLLSANNIFSNSKYRLNTVTYNPAEDKLIIRPLSGYGNSGAGDFIITFEGQYSSTTTLEKYLNDTISKFTESGRTPFSNSTVVYSTNTRFALTMNVQLTLTQKDYKLVFYSDPSNNPILGTIDTNPTADISNSNWRDLDFNISYNLGVNGGTVDVSGTFTTVKNNKQETTNTIIIGASNDTFYLTPYSTIDGLQTANNIYQIAIKIPHAEYPMTQLVDAINTSLSQNPLSSGTRFSLVSIKGNTFISVRFNINKVFSTKDYRVVFYDPFSFVKCYSATSKKGGPHSGQNATWDSTLGWLLGFRNSIEYNLSDYVGITDVVNSADNLGYYLNTAPNACVLFGDTCVSTNLYNYFLIMLDDYVQNHLNDGLVTITSQETVLTHAPSKTICDPSDPEKQIIVPADYGDTGVNYTQAQLYAFNERVKSDASKTKSYSSGPFVRDIFGIVPVKTAGLNVGSSYVEFGGTLQNQQRLYFGPVNIHRMTIQLLNDRGNLVDLNRANWSFSFICEQLYKNGYS